jgi:hypothetical protein
MTLEIIEDKKIWDRFVDDSPYAALSHKWDFLKIAEKHSGYKLRTYGFYKSDKLLGIYPLFFKRIKGLKLAYSPPPNRGMPNLGFVVSKEYDDLKQSKKESFLNFFLGEIETEIRKYSPDYMLVYTVPNFPDMRFFKWNGYDVLPKYTYVVDLTRPLEEIWDNFHKDVKRCVKLANGYGLELRTSNDISTLHERQERRYREKAANFSMDGEYLKEVFKAYPDNTKVYYVYNNRGEVVSGMNSQEYNGRFMLWMGIARAKEHANEFLIWKVMEKARSEGFKKFEIAGADEEHLNQFKSRFSPSLETWYRISKMSLFGKAAESFVDLCNITKKRMFIDTTFVIVSLFNAFHGIFEIFFENRL